MVQHVRLLKGKKKRETNPIHHDQRKTIRTKTCTKEKSMGFELIEMKAVGSDMFMYYCPICSVVYSLPQGQGQSYLCTRHNIEEARGIWVNIDTHDDEYNCQKPWPIPEHVDLILDPNSEGRFSKLLTCWNPDHLVGDEYHSKGLRHFQKAEVKRRFEKFLLLPIM